MQTTTFSPQELASIARELIVRAQARGPQILGAQLGKIVNSAIYPRNAKDLGGLRALVEDELRHLVRYVGDDASPDVVYEILNTPIVTPALADVPAKPTPVAGSELWRFFSNPNIACVLALTPEGQVVVGQEAAILDPGSVPVNRFGVEGYKELAEQFLKDAGNAFESPAGLYEALKSPNFYKTWIAELRKIRSDTVEPLKRWEIWRIESVAKRLNEELLRAGLDPSRAAEISQLARPVTASAKRLSSVSHVLVSHHGGWRPGVPPHAGSHQADRFGQASANRHSMPADKAADDLATLRRLVHQAVDRMSLAELSEIRLSAALLLELSHTRTV